MPVGYVTNFEPVGAGIGFGGTNLHQPPADYDKTKDPVFPGNTPVADPAISVRGLTKSFGKNTVLEDISIDFPRGKIKNDPRASPRRFGPLRTVARIEPAEHV